MRRTWPILVFVLFGALPLTAQTLFSVLQRADSTDKVGNHAAATKLYEQAYGLSGFDPVGLGIAARAAAKAGLNDIALRDLERAIDQGYLEPRLLGDSAFKPVRKDPRWKLIEAKLERKIAALNHQLRSELIKLGEQDQANRQDFNALMKKVQANSPERDAAFKAFNGADSAIQLRVRAIIAQHGWPTRSMVADDGAHAAWLVVQHMQKEDQDRLLPKLLAAVKAGEAQAGDGALLQDRVLVRNKKPQMYGSQLSIVPGSAKPVLEPIGEPECVDVRRKSVGLGPLADYLVRYGIGYKSPGVCIHKP